MQHVHVESELTPIRLPREQLLFPLALRQPRGFKPDRPKTWPHLEGRLEFVGGNSSSCRLALIFRRTSQPRP